jgi:DNA repair exonuclease SbcCD nuclease subunit
MDLQELKTKYPLLISYMEDHNYSQQYIRLKNESLWILRESGNHDWKTYDDIYQTYVEKYTNKYTLNYKRKMLLVIKRFVLESVVPDDSIHTHKPSYYDSLCINIRTL